MSPIIFMQPLSLLRDKVFAIWWKLVLEKRISCNRYFGSASNELEWSKSILRSLLGHGRYLSLVWCLNSQQIILFKKKNNKLLMFCRLSASWLPWNVRTGSPSWLTSRPSTSTLRPRVEEDSCNFSAGTVPFQRRSPNPTRLLANAVLRRRGEQGSFLRHRWRFTSSRWHGVAPS